MTVRVGRLRHKQPVERALRAIEDAHAGLSGTPLSSRSLLAPGVGTGGSSGGIVGLVYTSVQLEVDFVGRVKSTQIVEKTILVETVLVETLYAS